MSDESTRTEPNSRLLKSAAISLEKGYKPFLRDFDPETSEREKRKLNQRLNNGGKKARFLYDENGLYVKTGEDLCDCLEPGCPGCHFPCPKCTSTKCGYVCRSNRKWAYKSIAYEGTNIIVKNPYLDPDQE